MDVAKIDLATWPTPVVPLARVSRSVGVDVWAKLEERCGTWGGNKVRKLEHILGRAGRDGVERLVGFGAGTSNWTSALAYHGSRRGFGVEVHLTSNEIPAHYARLYRATGTVVVTRSPARWWVELQAARLLPERGPTRYLPIGGSGGEGDIGSFDAGVEIAEAVAGGRLPAPRCIFVACGTAGTAAGVAVGAAAGGIDAEVVCVRVTPRPYGTLRLVRRIAASIQRRAGLDRSVCCALRGVDNLFAPGYARSNPHSVAAARLALSDGIHLDQTYAAKAFAALVAHARRNRTGPLLFLHTSPGPPPDDAAA